MQVLADQYLINTFIVCSEETKRRVCGQRSSHGETLLLRDQLKEMTLYEMITCLLLFFSSSRAESSCSPLPSMEQMIGFDDSRGLK